MNILTFDLEEWFTYQLYPKGGPDYYLPILEKYLDNVLGLLERTGTKATFFSLGQIAREHPKVIAKIASKGHEIACHSDKHVMVTRMTPEAFMEDTRVAIDSLEQVVGKDITCYRAPAFSITESTKWAFDILQQLGISIDCSILPGEHRLGGYKSLDIKEPFILTLDGGILKEFPISYFTVFGRKLPYAGGGYFRLFPYFATSSLTRSSSYTMTYFHIRDFDKEQKRIYSKNYFYSYFGISGAIQKLERYVSDFQFVSVAQAADLFDWSKSQKVSLVKQGRPANT